jgi:hypothetical protein
VKGPGVIQADVIDTFAIDSMSLDALDQRAQGKIVRSFKQAAVQ